ncbi:MAG: hypothetical protein ABMA02_01090 [Saprospiraceae bacterium]
MGNRKKIIFVIGSPNQTTQMHQIASHLEGEFDCFFTQFYPDTFWEKFALRAKMMETTIMSGHFKRKADQYLRDHNLRTDYMARQNHYDLAVLCTDLIVPRQLRKGKTLWVQEGMTDAMTPWAHFVKKSRVIPRYFAMSTALNGSSNLCDLYCVASEGYRDYFTKMGTERGKIVATGMPNFDNLLRHRRNDFPHRDYVLVATSDIRECFRHDDRVGFLQQCKQIAAGRPVIFKLHPNEIRKRAIGEIKSVFGNDARILTEGNSNDMVANCCELITQYSTLVYVGIILGKKVHSYFDLDMLYRLTPLQNDGSSALHIAEICRNFIYFDGDGPTFVRSLSHRQILEPA